MRPEPERAWLRPRAVDGGADMIPLPRAAGRLWLCGKHAVGPDPQLALDHLGLDSVVCLTRRHEIAERFPGYVAWLDGNDAVTEPSDGSGPALWFPIPDLHAPPLAEILPLLVGLHGRLSRGDGLLVHCGAGIGRAGTTAVALCILDGMALDEALAHVRAHRPMGGPEVGAQLTLVTDLAAGYSP